MLTVTSYNEQFIYFNGAPKPNICNILLCINTKVAPTNIDWISAHNVDTKWSVCMEKKYIYLGLAILFIIIALLLFCFPY